ncbi:MAG: hypothetical protein IPQ07_37700 [Myxococcales bacterium]|nr:hypothetical protein [Myxococcales bacterium]
MHRLGITMLAAWLAGCDVVFGFTPPDGVACERLPRQQVQGLITTGVTLTLEPNPTEMGSLLVLTTVGTFTQSRIASIVDDGNTWIHAPVLLPSSLNNAALDLWYVAGAKSVSSVAVQLSVPYSMAASLSEWTCPAAMPFVAGASAPAAMSSLAATGSLSTSVDSLVIGAVAFSDVTTTATLVETPGFTELNPFATPSAAGGRAAFAWQPPGTYELNWTLSPASSWVGAIVSFEAR